ncbi:MAG: CopD family protein [Sphingobacteriaceae bacterium]|nr:CopD family protein [Sphingobacteriaceae bacterium]
MDFLYIKSLHIVFVVCWFAALFYMVRLFIYTAEAQKKEEPEKTILTTQLLIMQKKLWYIIGWPSMSGTFIFGWWMIWENTMYLALPWMWLKLILVGALFLYHLQCQMIYKKQLAGTFVWGSFKLRLFNEVATVFLVGIVFLVTVKSTGSLVWSLLGLIIFAALMMAFVTIYKNMREKNKAIEEAKETEEKKGI